MARKTSRQAIEKRIQKALQCLEEGDSEDAIFNISPIIDVVAKERHKDKKGVGERIKAFIFDEQALIYYLSMQGTMSLPEGVRIVMTDDSLKPVGNHDGELADFIYHNIRCAQVHDGEIDYSLIDFGREFGIGRSSFVGDGHELAPGLFIVSRATVLALILAVICAPETGEIKLLGNISLYNRILLDKNELVGNKDYLMTKLHQLFGQLP